MKLITSRDFRDYWDPVAHTLREESPIYVRTESPSHYLGRADRNGQRTYEASQWILKVGKLWQHLLEMPRSIYCCNHILGFCGKFYPIWEINRVWGPPGNQHCYNVAEVAAEIEQIRIGFKGKGKDWFRRFEENSARPGKPLEFTKTDLQKWADACPKQDDAPFITFGVPTFLLKCGPVNEYLLDTDWRLSSQVSLILNPHLGRVGFERQLPAYDCFQELDQYLGNQLANTASLEPRGITDELKAEAHGYDKWSFRRQPGDDPKAVKRKKKEEEKAAKALEESKKSPPVQPSDDWEKKLVMEK